MNQSGAFCATLFGLLSAIVCAAETVSSSSSAPPGLINDCLQSNSKTFAPWDFGGSVRLRYEVKDHFAIIGTPGSLDFRDHGTDVDNSYMLERIRFHGGYNEKWFGMMLEGQSSLAQGDDRAAYTNSPPVTGTFSRKGDGPESDLIELRQAYVRIGNAAEFPLGAKIGRQELMYGEERLVGVSGWNNITRTFDAAKLSWQNSVFNADAFVSRVVIPEDGRFNVANDYDFLSGVYATVNIVPKHLLEIYFLARNVAMSGLAAEPSPQFAQASARDIYTFGFRFKSKASELGHWEYCLEAAGQNGSFRDARAGAPAQRLEQEAYMVIAQGGYIFGDAWAKPRLGIEYSHGSGDGNPHDNKHETFDNLFPTNHKYYGYMDFFSLQNLHDVRLLLQFTPWAKLGFSIEGHGFWLADTHDSLYNVSGVARGGTGPTPGTGYGVNPDYGAFVGTELDAVATLILRRYAQLEAGYGHFFTGDYVRSSLSDVSRSSADANWIYLQATLTF